MRISRAALALVVVALAACGDEHDAPRSEIDMNRVIDTNAKVAPPAAPGAGTPGYFGNPDGAGPATLIPAHHLHMLTEEQYQVVIAGGLTPSSSTYTQLRDAIAALRAAYLAAFAVALVPDVDVTRDIGSASKRVRDLYSEDVHATAYKFPSARTRHHVIAGYDAEFGDDAGVAWKRLGLGLSEVDPTASPASLVVNTGAPSGVALWPVHLPQGAIITGGAFVCDITNNIGSTWGYLRRRALATPGSATSLSTVTPTTGESLASTTGIETRALTIDASAAVRTVDNSLYWYEAGMHTLVNVDAIVYAVQITYTLAELDTP